MDKLYIVIPAYNEEENIEAVVQDWHKIVVSAGNESRLVIIDDGSKDSTYQMLTDMQSQFPQLIAVTKQNSGHGGTILFGYKYALENGADYIFQTDSDGQTLPDEFMPFWEERENYDIQIGHRKHREDGFSRKFVTKVLKFVLFISFGKWIKDANTPFRLMKSGKLSELTEYVPQDYNLSNVLLTVLYEKSRVSIRYMPITFRPRQGGINSINMKRIFKIGRKALKDFRLLRKHVKQVKN